MKFSIEKIVTKDNFVLDGLFFEAVERDIAIVFIHGFPSNFCRNINLVKSIGDFGYSVLSLNTRGHDVLSIIPRVDKGYEIIGSAKENFEDCIFDIGGAVEFLKGKGYKKIFLMGISSGADKVGFYLSRNKESVILGGIFISPGSNISIARNELGEDFLKLMNESLKCIDEGKGDELLFNLIPVSCKRFVSLYSEDSSENVFPFHNNNSDFPILAKIKKPMFIALGERDSFYNNPKLLLEVLKSKLGGKSNEFKLFKAGHSFDGVEEELVCQIKAWVGRIV